MATSSWHSREGTQAELKVKMLMVGCWHKPSKSRWRPVAREKQGAADILQALEEPLRKGGKEFIRLDKYQNDSTMESKEESSSRKIT